MSDDDDDEAPLFRDNVDYGVGAGVGDALAESDADDEAVDDENVDDETGAAEDLHLVEDPATDIFNEADEPPQQDFAVELTERERLTVQWKKQVKPALNTGKATSKTALGVSKRYDVSVGIKRRAVALKAGGMAFALVQIEVYVLSRGLSKLSNRKQLREWGTISEAALASSKRQRGANVDKCEHSVRLAEWFTERRRRHLLVTCQQAQAEASRLLGKPVHKGWWWRWKCRYKVVTRSIQRQTKKTEEEIKLLLLSFHTHVFRNYMHRLISFVINFDEIPWPPSGSMNKGTTLDFKGTKNVIVHRDPRLDKRAASFIAVLACAKYTDGWAPVQMKCAVLLRREAKTPWVLNNPEGWLINESKTGVVTGNWMVHSFIPFLKAQIPEIEGVPLIIMDSASGHIQSDSKASLQTFSMLSTIAGGGTQHVQAVDTDYTAVLRFLYREKCYIPWTENQGKVTAMQLANLMISWLVNAHKASIEFMDTVKVFRKLGYITPSPETIHIRSVDGYKFTPMPGAALPDRHLGPAPPAVPPPMKKTIFDSWKPGPNPILPLLAPPRPPTSHAPKGMLK